MESSVRDSNMTEQNEEKLLKNECNSNDKKISLPPYPRRIFFIIGMEFCERFSYYGMRTILVLYARNYLLFDDDSSTAVYHAFTLLAYLTPLFGGILADSYIGKYKAIAYLSVVYVLGHVLKTVAAIPYIPSPATHIGLSMAGLFLIAVGTGGIKPCVSSFGGDQFTPIEIKRRSQYFSLFYFSINLGALISKWLTPMFRADLNCYPGHDEKQFQECFSVAFGIPGLLMLIALGLFLVGTSFYTCVPAEGSVFWKFCRCIGSALKNRWFKRSKQTGKTKHWIQYSNSPKKMKQDTTAVLRVLFLFLPLPFFWALFDQQGSRWTLQALQLNGYWGNYLVKPDQIDVINPLLIVLLIPTFEVTLYPLLRHCKINFTPLKKMGAGLILAGLSFVCAAALQYQIDKQLTTLPSPDEFSVRIINVSPCTINMTSCSDVLNATQLQPNHVSDTKKHIFQSRNSSQNIKFNYSTCDNTLVSFNVSSNPGHVNDIVLGANVENTPIRLFMPTTKLENGSAMVSFVNLNYPGNLSVQTEDFKENIFEGERSRSRAVKRGVTNYVVYSEKNKNVSIYDGSLISDPGGVYTVMLMKSHENERNLVAVKFNDESYQLQDVNPNSINIAWMIPQYFIITVGEVFLSVTGLEFSYTQAPKSMKSVLSSFWLLTVSMGNVIVLAIAKAKPISRQAHEFLLFAGLIGIAAIIFIVMAKSYKPVSEDEFEEEETTNRDIDEDGPLVSEI